MASEATVARESSVNPINAIGGAKRSLSTINKALESITRGEGLSHYAKYGDIVEASLKSDGTLNVMAVGKAYGDGRTQQGSVPILTDDRYRSIAPKRYRDWRGREGIEDVSIDYAANTLVRDIQKMGVKVKKVNFIYQWD